MDSNSIYQTLQELFPQVDVRLLKAVALEHSGNALAAVEDVLTVVLPYVTESSISPISPRESWGFGGSSDGGVDRDKQSMILKRQQVVEEENAGPSLKPGSIASENANDIDRDSDALHVNSICLDEEIRNSSSVSNPSYSNDGHDQVCVSIESEVLMPLGKGQEINVKVGPDKSFNGTSITLMQEDSVNDGHDQVFGNIGGEELILFCENGTLNGLPAVWKDYVFPVANNLTTAILRKGQQEESSLDSNPLEVGNSAAQLVPPSVQEHIPDASDFGFQSKIDSSASSPKCEKPETSGSSDLDFKQDSSVSDVVDFDDESTLNTLVTRSGQICRIDLLEDIIEDAKNNKKTLFSAMESVINMMREVELKEKAVEQAKGEAARGGLDILTKVEELKKMLGHAKEANDMHAGEVYGEKSILATEARELQSRLLSLSDERDKSLAILDEMHQTLEVRLTAAEEERKAVEQEKLEKEESAQRALAEQEAVMTRVVQESKILQQEAEENSKLREFLMDRGHVVDMLQGEISVICQDVRLLKEKFDERVPLSQSVSSSQTTCILASSSSSLRSVASVQVLEQGESYESPKRRSQAASIDGQSLKSSPAASIDGQSPKSGPEEKRGRDDRKALLDDGWDFFDNNDGCN
ncbi:hypothetical protein L1049_004659 [Liquidambar formosana]|uniref:CUE domain-containing protein n=1 Tax=Liquidambar formosana TaxID=63359 RepID=A0AAP0WVW4_LIQFO